MNKLVLYCAFVAFAAFALVAADGDEAPAEGALKTAAPFEENHVGYDLHNDFFYFNDELVAEAYKRAKYTDAKFTLAGQVADMTGREVPKASSPFVVAQKSVSSKGTLNDRWDVKEDENGNQYLALYHGKSSDYVVNKLRAHLLRQVANNVKDMLPQLDDASEKVGTEADEDGQLFETVKEEVKRMVAGTFKSVDELIRDSMRSNDDKSASANVVIKTKWNVIVASVGQGKVLSYDSTGVYTDLSDDKVCKLDSFGACKSKNNPAEPNVDVYQRYFQDEDGDDAAMQFILVQTPTLAKMMDNDELIKIILGQVNQHKHVREHEQELYTSAASRILQTAVSKLNLFTRMSRPDFSLMLLGLETDYTQIH